jgi:hypothetical protein
MNFLLIAMMHRLLQLLADWYLCSAVVSHRDHTITTVWQVAEVKIPVLFLHY